MCFFLPIPNLQFPKVLHQFRHRAVSSQRVVLLVEGIHVLQPMKRDPLPLRVVIVGLQDTVPEQGANPGLHRMLPGIRFTSQDYRSEQSVVKSIEESFKYPVIVKPVNLGSSVGISKADNTRELEDALELAFGFAERVLVEPAVTPLREINCSVLGDYTEAEASELEEPLSADKILSYKDKYMDGGKKTGGSKGMSSLKRKIPADIPADTAESIKKTAVDAFKYLDCNGVVRIDFLMNADTGEFWINEFNTIPGSLAFYLWEPVGVKYPQLLDKMISLALKRQRANEEITYSFDTNILSSASFGGAKGSKGAKR